MTATGATHRHPDGRFFNPWPGARPHGLRDFLRWRRERYARLPPDPDPSVFPLRTPRLAAPRAGPHTLAATWIGHSTVLVQLGALNVLTDPMWSARASPLPWLGPRRWVPPGVALEALPPIDIVLISHSHYDHLDASTVRRLAHRHPHAEWAVPLELGSLVRRFGAQKVRELDWWEECELAGARVACAPAQHFSARSPRDVARMLWCGWSVRAGGQAVYFAGDTAYHPEFAAIGARHGPFDLALLPIGCYEPRWFMGTVHMSPEEAVQAFRELDPADRASALAIHWGTFKLADEPMDEPPVRLRAAWRAAGLDPARLLVLAHGETGDVKRGA